MGSQHLWQKHSQLMATLAREREQIGVAAAGCLCEIDDFGRVRWATAKVEWIFARYFPDEAPSGDWLPATLLTRLKEVVARWRANDPGLPVRWSWRWPWSDRCIHPRA